MSLIKLVAEAGGPGTVMCKSRSLQRSSTACKGVQSLLRRLAVDSCKYPARAEYLEVLRDEAAGDSDGGKEDE